MGIIIYHNPRCSKSRQTMSLIREQGHTPKIIEYLKEPPSVSEILNILSLLELEPRAILRTKEGPYKELKLSNSNLTVHQLVEAIDPSKFFIACDSNGWFLDKKRVQRG